MQRSSPFLMMHRMKYIADFHIHSRYSLATSKELSPPALHRGALLKGLTVIGTGDFTHPAWVKELEEQLQPAEPGLLRLKPDYAAEAEKGVPNACQGEVRFVLTAEISNIYKYEQKTRKVHNLIFVPDFETARAVTKPLANIGRLASDGRPILKQDSRELLAIVSEESDRAFLVPAHIWTPHFSVLGAFSGFSSVEECYGKYAEKIFAVETGLSSDPPMNWRLSSLDRFALISNSDAHSPEKLAREANLFDTDLSYDAIAAALRKKDGKGFQGTLEFFPEEGKYHYDGHRPCNICLTPRETERYGGRCPSCNRKITLGVCHRVEALADRPEKFSPPGALPFESLIALKTILSEVLGVGPNTKKVSKAYEQLLARFGPELKILREVPPAEIASAGIERLDEAIRRVRCGEVHISPGYDGHFGTISIFTPPKRKKSRKQQLLY